MSIDHSSDHAFETETMAELHARQGRLPEAVAIFRRLADTHPGHPARDRWQARTADLIAQLADQSRSSSPTIQPPARNLPNRAAIAIPPAPGVVAVVGRGDAGESAAIIAWALPPTPTPPVLEILLVTRGSDGIETERRRVTATASAGQLVIPHAQLHAVAAAAGQLEGSQFVAMARSARESH